ERTPPRRPRPRRRPLRERPTDRTTRRFRRRRSSRMTRRSTGIDNSSTAEAKGLYRIRVVGKHALKNAAVPVVTVFGIEANRLIGGTVVIEQLFAIPGVGQLAYQSVFSRDFPVVQGVLLVTAAMVLTINLLVDVSYGYFNPRIRQA
ncbi:MAG: ABC transporter permease subunit, partial [Actinophytocola sp.]|nr:ABC transporter permease subunit [Actinophytocola sp.]